MGKSKPSFTMMFRTLSLCAVSAAGVSLRNEVSVTCGPQTQIEYSGTADAAGTPSFTPVTVNHNSCVDVAKEATDVKLCGPGKFTISRMTCNQHDYKSMTVSR